MSTLRSILLLANALLCVSPLATARPNFLFAIADDQSYPYASAYGTSGVNTPAFDRMAQQGVLFHNAFAPAPQCSPCRAAILTGRNIWQIEEAGTHGSHFPKKFPVFTRTLEGAGYHVGWTGKAWSPGNYKDNGWKRNPVGTEYSSKKLTPPAKGMSDIDYAANFEDFLDKRTDDQPFFFWYGCKEPHRVYEYGSGQKAGKQLEEATVPAFLPAQEELIKNDVLDYSLEIDWFDTHLGRIIAKLEAIGELENTVVVITADNGMPFPYAKANLQEFGTHVPLVVSGKAFFPGGRISKSPVSLIDLAPTFLELANVDPFPGITGKSLMPFLKHMAPHRPYVLTGRERHSHARPDNFGYPARAIRTEDYLYVWNIKPDRWPAGNPIPEGLDEAHITGSFSRDYKAMGVGYPDIDPSPSKTFIYENEDTYPDLFHLAFGRRPEEQLYDISKDPGCLNNLARNPDYESIRTELSKALLSQLKAQGDPRVHGKGDIFESYPRFGGMRFYPGFKKRGEYNPAFQQKN
ncbi:sulfatase [Opitutia bacterium ISCC 51]|nr:sulfatase [Opitutae bacterium ISCC 51]QXD27315.1 sulfatase [Opitutae bacterium ISCC 52]